MNVHAAVAAGLTEAGIGARHRLCCALSGGVDSVVLLDALHALQPQLGFVLEAAHVNHGLSPAADDWQALCGELCQRYGVPLHVFRVEVSRDHPDGLEAAARVARHGALAQVGCDWLVLGHHRDDQAETVLFRLLRGTGVQGAAAMAAIEPAGHGRAGRLRPLLDIGRDAILACARARGLVWVNDASNADLRFARNDLRHRILPAIETVFPGARATLARAAAHFREAAGLLDELAEADADACERVPGVREARPLPLPLGEGGGEGEGRHGSDIMATRAPSPQPSPRGRGSAARARIFARSSLLALSPARLANLLRRELRRLGALPPETAQFAEAMRQLRASAGPLLLPLGTLACYSYREQVWLAPPLEPVPQAVAWQPAPGETAWAGGTLLCRAAAGEGIAASVFEQATTCRLTPRTPGLQLRLALMRPQKSFKKLCQEAGIPVWLRERLPVLEVDGQAVWVGSLGVAADCACAPGEPGWMLEWRAGV